MCNKCVKEDINYDNNVNDYFCISRITNIYRG